MEGKSQSDKGQVIRSVYFYLASLVTLGIIIGSVIFLFNLGLKVWVFTNAEPVAYRIGAPPTLLQASRISPDAVEDDFLTCTEECTLTTEQKENISTWETNYKTWQENKNSPNAGWLRDAINAFSFLIIAIPFFIIHFRIVQKDAKKEQDKEKAVIRPTYFYLISLAALLMIVIAGGMLINLGLKTWVFPSAGEADNAKLSYERVAGFEVIEKSSVQSIVDCGDKCGVGSATVTLASQWVDDYNTWDEVARVSYNNTQRQAASNIPFIIIGIPLFWYHWNTVRKEKKGKQEE